MFRYIVAQKKKFCPVYWQAYKNEWSTVAINDYTGRTVYNRLKIWQSLMQETWDDLLIFNPMEELNERTAD